MSFLTQDLTVDSGGIWGWRQMQRSDSPFAILKTTSSASSGGCRVSFTFVCDPPPTEPVQQQADRRLHGDGIVALLRFHEAACDQAVDVRRAYFDRGDPETTAAPVAPAGCTSRAVCPTLLHRRHLNSVPLKYLRRKSQRLLMSHNAMRSQTTAASSLHTCKPSFEKSSY